MCQKQTDRFSDLPPARLRRFVKRMALLQPGMAYSITLFVPEGESEPQWTVLLLGKIENYLQKHEDVLR